MQTVDFSSAPPVQFILHGKLLWKSHDGPQSAVLHRREFEVLYGGARGGGKSIAGIAWLVMGDTQLPKSDPAHYSYINDRNYRAVVLRREHTDLEEWIEEARNFYTPFGGKTSGKPAMFEFPSGAKIYTNHLKSDDAFEKYKGWNITRLLIEELTLIPKQGVYLKMHASVRVPKHLSLRPQIFCTTNPDGEGSEWVKNRFVEVPNPQGGIVPWGVPMKDPITRKNRIFIPARLKDNPSLGEDYRANLLAQEPHIRAAWLDGDWNASKGKYFESYRPMGPRRDSPEPEPEPDAANHLIDPVELKPWWFRWLSCDWGYDHPSSCHKYCKNQRDGRIHVYDEMSVRKVGSFELGTKIAQWCAEELRMLPDHQMTMYLSHDAFSKDDEVRTKAEQLEAGIKEVLGPYGAFLVKYSEDEKAMQMADPKRAAILFERRRQEMQGKWCISIKRASRDRVAGFQYMRELMRWWPVMQDLKPDMEHAKYLYEHVGAHAYEKYLGGFREAGKAEILPKVLIWKKCSGLDRCLRSAVHNEPPKQEDVKPFLAENGVGGDDPLDSGRYGLMANKEIEIAMPKEYHMQERMDEARTMYTDPTVLAQIERHSSATFDLDSAGTGSIILPRSGSLRHWRN